jgi:ATP-dependent DNA ligase
MILQRRHPSGFIEPCLPSKEARPPSGSLWVHEIKHDGYRLMLRRGRHRVRVISLLCLRYSAELPFTTDW